jgi:hypothetical protein
VQDNDTRSAIQFHLDGYLIKATPYSNYSKPKSFNFSLAIIVDQSYSMNKVKTEVRESLHWLKSSGVLMNQKVDVYPMTTPYWPVEEAPLSSLEQFNLDSLLMFGGSSLYTMLKQFTVRSANQTYGILHSNTKLTI